MDMKLYERLIEKQRDEMLTMYERKVRKLNFEERIMFRKLFTVMQQANPFYDMKHFASSLENINYHTIIHINSDGERETVAVFYYSSFDNGHGGTSSTYYGISDTLKTFTLFDIWDVGVYPDTALYDIILRD